MCARRKQSVIFKIDRTMNYFLLAETDFFRLINEAGDCNMEKAYTAFATQVIELCNGGMDMNLTVIALAYIEIELQHHPVRNLSEEKKRDCRLRQQGSVFRKKDAEIPCHAPSATTNIRQQRNRNHRQPSSMDGQCHRPRGTYLRHRRDGLHQQRQYAAQTARPTSL